MWIPKVPMEISVLLGGVFVQLLASMRSNGFSALSTSHTSIEPGIEAVKDMPRPVALWKRINQHRLIPFLVENCWE